METAVTLQTLYETPALVDVPGRNSYVVEPLKILYVSVPKNACTSLKRLIAKLAGEDLSGFRPDLVRRTALHLRTEWSTPRLDQIDPETRRTISPDNGWFVFAVVRDPRSRLFSAWQDKFLGHPPAYREWNQADWYPKPPEYPDDVVRDFARFVQVLSAEPDHPLMLDPHFAPQTDLIRPGAIPYSRLYDLAELPTLLADMAAHLDAQGVDHDLTRPPTNETLLRANGRVFVEPVRSQIEQMYAADFDNFGHLWDYGRIERAAEWTPESLQAVRARILVHERLGFLADIGLQERARAQGAERLVRQADHRITQLTRRAEHAERQLERLRERAEQDRARAGQRLTRMTRRAERAERQLNRVRQRAARADARVAKLLSMRATRVGLAARALRGRLRGLANRR
jgi:hypothetical protein